ncbi:uncharacterized protein LOC142628738 [Castanea sativa]|uniref:uncharacterized protein LOC142628738 n=1 Tax=Castanea sativa TaxID=21020 RepID=UPI003F654049
MLSITLDSKSWTQAHRYVLFSCDEITPFHTVHRDHLKELHPNVANDGSLVNAEATSNIKKINELLSESSNRVQSSDLTSSILWAPDDVYAQVFGNEHNGRVQGVGFGPTPSMHPAKSTTAIAQVRSQERDAEVTQLKNQVASLMEKVNGYENLEEQVTQLMQLVQNQQNHSLEASRVLNFTVLRMYLGGFSLDHQSSTPYGSQALSHQETSA